MGEQLTYSVSEGLEISNAGMFLKYIDASAFKIVRSAPGLSNQQRTELFAEMARFNTLYMITRAGSGHIGSSFSSIDIVASLYLNVLAPGDRYFSSKGHDCPGLYAVQTALGILPYDKIHSLRRLNGLPGHPDISMPGTFTNTGSLGMGISKAKGFLAADTLIGNDSGRIFVLMGDGELQEGQFWESLAGATRRRDQRLTIIIDHNKIQSDTYVTNVSDLGDLEAKLTAFGCYIERCSGHDLAALERILPGTDAINRTRVIIADTVKGRGVTFMEHTSMPDNQPYYRYHSGAPSADDYQCATHELLAKIDKLSVAARISLPPVRVDEVQPLRIPSHYQRLIPAYSEAILNEAKNNPRIVALNADLILDTGLIPFKDAYPHRFIECGIAEQDMVSMAGTLALAGALPVVHSFANFITARSAEQIYNNISEKSKIIYVGSLAGILPGGPGHSHQSVRDILTMSALPNLVLIEPVTPQQVASSLRWAIRENKGSTYLRLCSIPLEIRSENINFRELKFGQGHIVREGEDATIFITSAVLLTQALLAGDLLASKDIEIRIISLPWLNRLDLKWVKTILDGAVGPIITLENHYVEHGFGTWFISQLATAGLLGNKRTVCMGINDLPACGRNDEILQYHKLDAKSIANTIYDMI